MLSLIVSDGDADLPQHLLAGLTDRRPQSTNGGRGVEIENRREIFAVKAAFRFQSTAGHQGVGDADGSGGLELHLDVIIIVLLQERIVNDVEEVPPMILPICPGQLSGHVDDLLGKIAAGCSIAALQHGGYRFFVLFLQLPQPGGTGMFAGAGVGNIEHIAQPGTVAGIVHQGNAFGPAPHIPPHLVIPKVVLGAGGGVRALGIDHHLILECVLVKAGGGGEKSRPFLPVPSELDCHLVGHPCILFCFGWHSVLLPVLNKRKSRKPG